MRTSTRDRVVLPILLPIVMLLVIAAVLFGFSRILLSLTADAATGIALVVALSILVVAAVVASRSVVRASSLASMLGAIAGVAMLAGGIALIAVGTGGEKEGGGSGGPVTISLTAKGLAFDKTKLSVPAGNPFAIAFDNQDAGIQHDVQIFDNEGFTGTPLLNGEIVTGPAKVTYEAPALDPGTYFFHCSVHPAQMHGTIDATAGAPGGGAKVTVAAQGLQFDTDRIELPAAPSIIHFENDDPGIQHNIAIFTDSSLGTNLFRGEIVTGPAAIDYRIPPLEPGTYYFHCDVHPTMSGAVVVKKGGGGPPPPTATPGGGVGGAGGGGTANPSTIMAQGLAFSTPEIALPPDAPSTIHFEDKDAGVSHNIAIYTDSSLGTNLFKGQIITGPASIDYSIPALKPGTYYFHCDVHPTMHGSVTVG